MECHYNDYHGDREQEIMSEISERYWKRKIPVHQIIQTPWGESKEIGVSANFIVIKLKNGDVRFIEENKIIIEDNSYRYTE